MIDALLIAASLACASCGSGGDEPMILYPNESAKAYLGVTHASGFRTVGVEGDYTEAAGPESKDTVTISLGKSLTRRSFITAAFPYARNERDGKSQQSLMDPSISARYTVVMQTIADPWIPQVQFLVGYKTAQARSIRETQSPGDLLDVFGTGFPEWRVGVDLWYGLEALKFGAAWVQAYPQKRYLAGHEYQPGAGQRATGTIAYNWIPMFKSTIGVNREQRGDSAIDGEVNPQSDQVNQAAFVNQDWMLTPLDSLRLGYSRQAAFGANRNTARSVNISMAYMRSF